jgi:CheY-like chemotaxis protein
LSIAAEIIAGHNGKIYVDSIAEKGSIFMVQLPAAGEKPDNRKSNDSQNDKFKYKVLLVDDENAVGDTLAEMLRGEGCEVIMVNNPKEALVNFIKNDCDVVLTDLSMPDINGYELARKIKSMRKDIPVILITGWDQKSQDVNQDIIDGVIQKPFNIDQIRQEFNKVLENNGRS